jgi:muramoyltetrapeptide carboxypeptidase LdcA involved in peptidoglycan recycling
MPATSLLAQGTKASLDAFHSALFEGSLPAASPPLAGRTLQQGRAEVTGGVVTGTIVGGNLTLVTSLVGTPWDVDLRGAILFIEDGEKATVTLLFRGTYWDVGLPQYSPCPRVYLVVHC